MRHEKCKGTLTRRSGEVGGFIDLYLSLGGFGVIVNLYVGYYSLPKRSFKGFLLSDVGGAMGDAPIDSFRFAPIVPPGSPGFQSFKYDIGTKILIPQICQFCKQLDFCF